MERNPTGPAAHGAADEQISVVWVPGACEITIAAKKLAQSGKYAAVLCLGAVIRGQTPHYDYISQMVARGVGQVSYIRRRQRFSPF